MERRGRELAEAMRVGFGDVFLPIPPELYESSGEKLRSPVSITGSPTTWDVLRTERGGRDSNRRQGSARPAASPNDWRLSGP